MDIDYNYVLELIKNKYIHYEKFEIKKDSIKKEETKFMFKIELLNKIKTISFYKTGTVQIQPKDSELQKYLQVQFLNNQLKSVSIKEETTEQDDSTVQLKAFIVHGQKKEVLDDYCKVLMQYNIDPVILNEEENKGLTFIKKLELHVNSFDFGVIIVTNDNFVDMAEYSHPRLNVIYELGYLHGKLGRGETILVEPDNGNRLQNFISDIQGLVYVSNIEDFKFQVSHLKERLEKNKKNNTNK